MESLEGEVEARYAWETAAVVAQRGQRARIAVLVRPIVMRSAPSPYKDPRTGRERFEEFFPRPTLADFPPGWQPCSARQLHDAMEAGWKPTPPPPHSAYAAFISQR
jgi:hypothetical protein